jgi:uncharacterized damage-inducible protein DinB
MRPDQAKFLLDFLLPRLKSEQATTKKILAAVPPDQGDYRPHPRSMNAQKLSRHIAGTEMWFLDAVIEHVFKDDDIPPPAELKPGPDMARWYDENFAQRLPRLEALSGEHLATPVDYIGLLNDPAVAYLSFGIRHSVHHRGQLSAYLRPMGAKVPAIYVESADERFTPSVQSATS